MSEKDGHQTPNSKLNFIKWLIREPAVWVLLPTFILTFFGLHYLYNLVLSRPECGLSGSVFTNHLACMSLNEIGDLFAGAFAPIAFLWLMAAVALQSFELRAQRKEIAESRQISDEQKEAAKWQAEALRELSKILGRDSEVHAEERRFNTALNNIGQHISAHRLSLQPRGSDMGPVIVDKYKIDSMSPDDVVRHAASVVQRWDQNAAENLVYHTAQMKDQTGYKVFRELVAEAAEVARVMTGTNKSKLDVDTIINLNEICRKRFLD